MNHNGSACPHALNQNICDMRGKACRPALPPWSAPTSPAPARSAVRCSRGRPAGRPVGGPPPPDGRRDSTGRGTELRAEGRAGRGPRNCAPKRRQGTQRVRRKERTAERRRETQRRRMRGETTACPAEAGPRAGAGCRADGYLSPPGCMGKLPVLGGLAASPTPTGATTPPGVGGIGGQRQTAPPVLGGTETAQPVLYWAEWSAGMQCIKRGYQF